MAQKRGATSSSANQQKIILQAAHHGPSPSQQPGA
jgi:hypothetical protein